LSNKQEEKTPLGPAAKLDQRNRRTLQPEKIMPILAWWNWPDEVIDLDKKTVSFPINVESFESSDELNARIVEIEESEETKICGKWSTRIFEVKPQEKLDPLKEQLQRLAGFIAEIDDDAKFKAAKRLAQCGTDEEAVSVLDQIKIDCGEEVEDYFCTKCGAKCLIDDEALSQCCKAVVSD